MKSQLLANNKNGFQIREFTLDPLESFPYKIYEEYNVFIEHISGDINVLINNKKLHELNKASLGIPAGNHHRIYNIDDEKEARFKIYYVRN